VYSLKDILKDYSSVFEFYINSVYSVMKNQIFSHKHNWCVGWFISLHLIDQGLLRVSIGSDSCSELLKKDWE